ncbi:hypothetical protein LG329_17455 [Virgibacillus necropolis]|uniref:hypothetical protein n=1 Tax=Virgibacillus necropolis TaxID=163877 RepID=UPI00384BE3B4
MSGKVTTGELRDGQPFDVRYLTFADLSIIMQLQKKVENALLSNATLEPLSKEEFTEILSEHQFMIGVFVDEKMIAFRAMRLPEMDGEHLGIDAGLSDEELSKVIYQEISTIDPDYRGNGLQNYMGKLFMNRLDSKRFRYVCATVAPFNIPSIKDKLELGLEVVALKRKYGGKLRYIFMKDLADSRSERVFNEEVSLKMSEIEKQQNLLHSGFLGISIKEVQEEWYVNYCRI